MSVRSARLRLVAAVALVCIALTGCTGESSGAAAMTTAQALRYYTSTVCPVVPVYDAEQAELGTTDLQGLRAAATRAASVYRAVERRLRTPPAPWPARIRDQLPAFDRQLLRQARYFDAVARVHRVVDAVALDFPDGTRVSTPVEHALTSHGFVHCPA